MADANQLAAALQYQQELEAAVRPQMMNPNIAEQGRKGRANMAPPTSVMDPRSRDYERRSRETENFLIGADILAGALPFAPLAKGAVMAAGKYAGPELARGLENYMVKSGAVLPMDVWHGSPHRFPPTAKNPLGEFDPMKMGTGEGAQAYGVGAGYLAENPVVAKEYQKTLSAGRAPNVVDSKLQQLYDQTGNWETAVDKHLGSVYNTPKVKAQMRETMLKNGPPLNTEGGSLYKVDLPDEHIAKMLDWDKPLSQQHPDVQAVARKRLEELRAMGGSMPKDPTGEWIHKAFGPQGGEKALDELYGQSAASVRLREAGIPGIRYLDQGSRPNTNSIAGIQANLDKAIARLKDWQGNTSSLGESQRKMFSEQVASFKKILQDAQNNPATSNFVVFDPAHMNIIGRE